MKKIALLIIPVLLLLMMCSCSDATAAIRDLFAGEEYMEWEDFSADPLQYGSRYKNFFAQLSEDQKKGYNNILRSVYEAEDEFPEKIEIPNMSAEELSDVYEALLYDNPDIMCYDKDSSIITDGNHCYFEPKYIMGVEEFKFKKAEIESMADSIVAMCRKKSDQFERELFIHDYIIKNCRYKLGGMESGMVYTCLIEGYSSCEGYAKATKYLLERAGIEAYTVVGDSVNSKNVQAYHMWNIVKINGRYYYLDTTWDDPNLQTDEISYVYFNITQKDIENDHSDFTIFFTCSSTNDNYYVRKGSYFKTYNWSTYERIITLLGKEAKNGKNYIELRFGSKSAYDAALHELTAKGKAYTVAKKANARFGTNVKYNSISYTPVEPFLIFRMVFE